MSDLIAGELFGQIETSGSVANGMFLFYFSFRALLITIASVMHGHYRSLKANIDTYTHALYFDFLSIATGKLTSRSLLKSFLETTLNVILRGPLTGERQGPHMC